jgi:RNA polymerase sigma-70 factor, ECF subfamily
LPGLALRAMALTSDPPGDRRHDEDVELARRCERGDEDAQRSFVDRFGSLVYSICGRSGIDGADRDDVAQQILLDAFRALPCYQGTSRLSTWIYSLSLRRVADHYRSPQRRDVASGWPGDETFPASPAPPSGRAPDEHAAMAEERERVRGAVARLPEPERSVVIAYYLGEMSVAEVSRALNMPEGTVKTRLHRGRLALRKELMVP